MMRSQHLSGVGPHPAEVVPSSSIMDPAVTPLWGPSTSSSGACEMIEEGCRPGWTAAVGAWLAAYGCSACPVDAEDPMRLDGPTDLPRRAGRATGGIGTSRIPSSSP